MAVIEGIQIGIPISGQRAETIIKRMESLLAARRSYKVSRKGFLKQWGRLRLALFLTREYQELRLRVEARSLGVCELCVVEPMAHVHHIKPIAYHPRGALLDDNCKGLCRKCHRVEHTKAAKQT